MELLPLTLTQLKETNNRVICILSTPNTIKTLDRIGYKLASGDSILLVKTEKVLYLDTMLKSITYTNVKYYMTLYDHLPLHTLVTTTLKPKELKWLYVET